MAAAVAVVFGVFTSGLALVLTVLTIREKLRAAHSKPHPLMPALADIAAAIRERGPDLHVTLPDVSGSRKD